ncbi:hypothetical protein CHS0354_012518 [Potamilus streckersoni]|uniref:SRCR domain-containing protein n=1 Tax=Potamilus streckersoni TaxID=2493646 RepID=A0AAE0SVX8_9BIVA|nr:hypothetical protein CHS0354_012518 [Potamilus streckersoni]
MIFYVQCRSGAIALGNARYGQGSGPILIDDVDCHGTESSLATCSYTRINNCHHSEDVGVQCNTGSMESYKSFYVRSELYNSEFKLYISGFKETR